MRDGNRRGLGDGSGIPFGGGEPNRNGTNGVDPEGMDTRATPFGEVDDPIDLVAVQADDALINALAGGMAVTRPGVSGYDADDRVAAILAAWKAEVDSQPIPELVDIDTAVAAVHAGRPPSARARHLAPVAAAAAFLILAIGGLSVGSAGAVPGDPLWAVSKVLYSQRADSVEAAGRVEARIANAKMALVAGKPVVAVKELRQAEADLALVRPEEGGTELSAVQDFLAAKALETREGVRNDPGTPLATDSARQVPAGAAITADPKQTTPPSVTMTNLPSPVVPGPPVGTEIGPTTAVVPSTVATTVPPPSLPGGSAPPTSSVTVTPSATAEGSVSTVTPNRSTVASASASTTS